MPRIDGSHGLGRKRDPSIQRAKDSLKRSMRMGPGPGGMNTELASLPGAEKLMHVSFLEALPHLRKLLSLLWILAPARTVIMLLGNFTKSLLPATDLRIRAELIEIINTTIRRDRAFEGRVIGRLLILQLLSLIFRNFLNVALNNNQQVVNARLTAVLKRKLLETHLRLDTAALEQPDNQRLLQNANNMANPGYLSNLIMITFNLTNSITDITARIAATSQTISWAALPYFMLYSFMPLLRIATAKFGPLHWNNTSDHTEMLRREDLTTIAMDTKSRREVALLNLQDYLLEEYSKVDEKLQAVDSKRLRNQSWTARSLEILNSFSNPAIYAFLAWRSQTTNISLADLHLIENTTTGLINTTNGAIRTQLNSSNILTHLIDYYKALDLRPALPMIDKPLKYQAISDSGMKIEFQDVSFRYSEGGPLVLDKVSFVIKPGQVAALVGYNGSGKSTLISLLARVHDPTSGRILVNDKDLRDYNLDNLSRHMSFTHQDFAKWPLTGFENIAVGSIGDHTSASVEEAARATGAYEVLDAYAPKQQENITDATEKSEVATKLWDERLSKMTSEMMAAQNGGNNMQSVISRRGERLVRLRGTNGIELSGGQWAKVALSRTFLRKGDLLVLDEPSANLDPQAEYDLFSSLLKIRFGRTILFITHRLGVVRASDNILFLDKGCLVEQGSHEELMNKDAGMYRHLVSLQMDGFSKD